MSVAKRDYYEVLSVTRECDEQLLKTSYRKLALQYHPDRNPDNHEAEEKFKEAAEAYAVLSDPQKRAAYDRFGHQGVNGAGGGAPNFDESAFADFGDILGDLFGLGDIFGGARGGRRTRVQRGEDIRYDLEISFEDSMRGLSADLQIPRLEACSKCQGSGAEPNGGLIGCAVCNGRGEVVYQQSFLSIRKVCPTCGGRGKVIRHACNLCKGEGYSRIEKKLKVNIPAGVDTGTRLRLANEGNPPPPAGGQPGDLYVVVKVADHTIFERRETDLHCTLPINIAQAALGAEIEIDTFDGSQTIKVPEGTQSGSHFRLRNLGVPHLNSRARGDLYVHVDVQVPKKLSREQRKLFEDLREVLPVQNTPHEKSVFEKVRDFFG